MPDWPASDMSPETDALEREVWRLTQECALLRFDLDRVRWANEFHAQKFDEAIANAEVERMSEAHNAASQSEHDDLRDQLAAVTKERDELHERRSEDLAGQLYIIQAMVGQREAAEAEVDAQRARAEAAADLLARAEGAVERDGDCGDPFNLNEELIDDIRAHLAQHASAEGGTDAD